ncbi:hypothetical protein VZQ01_31375 [Myxococcus faecalis]|uniref:hypothetical protein n=1 Tax=Myxococcus faecalis TaxID=3115646 RepID=UPI003CF7757D
MRTVPLGEVEWVDAERVGDGARARLRAAGFGLAALGLAACAVAWVADARRFAFSYLVGFEFVLTMGLGGLFFVIIQHLVKAGWSVGPRRQMEWLAGVLPLLLVLFAPIAAMSGHLYSAWMGPEAATDSLVAQKAAYLNAPAFFLRAAVYFAIWTGLSWFFRSRSLQQDVSGDPALTLTLQRASAPATVLFGLSLTFSGVDWLMSLNPKWYSTMFGAYVFAGSTVSGIAVLALMTVALHRSGLIRRVSNEQHRYDVGKLLFGFTVFWAYIGFSQYFLIWYANIPEETLFFRERAVGSWRDVSMALVLLHFALPFVLLISRTMKKLWWGLSLGAVVVLVGHYIDLYWLVMPTLDREGARFTWIDAAGLMGPVGVLCAWLAWRATKDPLYPLRDPRLAEAAALDQP